MKNLIKSIAVFAIAYFAFRYLLWFGIGYAIIVSIVKKREANENNRLTTCGWLYDLVFSGYI